MSDQLFDIAVRDWLEDGSDRTPRPAIDAVLLAVKTTPQERVLRIPRRFNLMPTYVRLAAVAAVVAVIGFGALSYFGDGSRFGGATQLPPTPSPVPTASPRPTTAPTPTLGPLDTTGWVPFTSERYGFTIKRPADWTGILSDHDWTFEKDVESWSSTATESFFTTKVGGGVKVSAWAVRVTPGTTAESWIQSWCDGTNALPCVDLADKSHEVASADGHSGVFTQQTDTLAAFLVGETVYAVAIWRGEDDPSVKPYGGATRLLEGFIATVKLPAESPEGLPSPN
jgi:hypothetical protein